MDLRAYARVDADGADVYGVPPVAVNEVERDGLAVHEELEVAEALDVVRAEDADEIVARAGGVVRDGDVLAARRAVYAFVERAVASAGVDADLAALIRLAADGLAGVHRPGRDVYLEGLAARRGDLRYPRGERGCSDRFRTVRR